VLTGSIPEAAMTDAAGRWGINGIPTRGGDNGRRGRIVSYIMASSR
jgi:hypothetical protein